MASVRSCPANVKMTAAFAVACQSVVDLICMNLLTTSPDMNQKALFILLFGAFSSLCAEHRSPTIKVYFSPHGGCTEAVIGAIHTAKKSILVEAYSFTSLPIAEALIEAEHKGIDVEVILDKGQDRDRGSETAFLAQGGIPTYLDAAYKIDHNKFMVLDSSTVITGSFNYTGNAEKYNAENMLVISNDPELAMSYTTVWKKHLSVSTRYHPRKDHPINGQLGKLYPPLSWEISAAF